MTTATHSLLEKVLDLPFEEREELMEKLIESLDGPPGPAEDDPGFIAELTRRAERAIAGKSKGEDWETVHRELKRDLELVSHEQAAANRPRGKGRNPRGTKVVRG